MSNIPFMLSESPKIKYSKREKLVFDTILANDSEKISTKDIADKAFNRDEIFHVKATVISAIASLRKKVDFNKEPFEIKMSGHAGPHPMEVWIEKREN